ncbi:hypothetical protein ACROYT_G030386 [Oculina patagonica]
MSRNGTDENLSISGEKNGQPVQRTSARICKPSSSVDQEGIVLERIRSLSKQRGGVLSSLTATRREIDTLLTDENNLEALKAKLSETTSLFRRFTEAHDAYNAALVEESQRQQPALPVAKDEIPRQEDVERWLGYVHLSELNSKVDLLIGANVPEALQPREAIPACDGGPYATRVDLGWVINCPTGRKQNYVPSSSFFIKCKETHPMCAACADFADASPSNGLSTSRDDLTFMNIMEDSSVKCEDGHYQVTLLLKNPNLQMPANRSQTERWTLYLKRKFSKDVKFGEDYVAFLEEVISEGFAEKLPRMS